MTAEAARVPKRSSQRARRVMAMPQTALQKARAGVATGAYLDARDAARALTAHVNERLTALDAAATAKPPRRRR